MSDVALSMNQLLDRKSSKYSFAIYLSIINIKGATILVWHICPEALLCLSVFHVCMSDVAL